MRKVIQRRAMKTEDRENLDLLIDTYECALASKRLAADALSGGASVREAAKVSGLSVGSVAALRVVQNTKQIERPHHDPETGEISQPSQAANGGGDHDGGLLKQPMAEVARVAPPSMPSSAPVAASGPVDEKAILADENAAKSTPACASETSTRIDTTERPALQEVGAPSARPEGIPIDIDIPDFLRRERASA